MAPATIRRRVITELSSSIPTDSTPQPERTWRSSSQPERLSDEKRCLGSLARCPRKELVVLPPCLALKKGMQQSL